MTTIIYICSTITLLILINLLLLIFSCNKYNDNNKKTNA